MKTTAVAVAAVAALIVFCFWLDFKVWRLQHPQAPTWTYWADRGR